MAAPRLIKIPQANSFFDDPPSLPWWLTHRYARFAKSQNILLRFAAVGLVVRHMSAGEYEPVVRSRGRAWCRGVSKRHLAELGRDASRELFNLRDAVRRMGTRSAKESEIVILAERREYLEAACYTLREREDGYFLQADLDQLDADARRLCKTQRLKAPHSPMLASVLLLDRDAWWGELAYVRLAPLKLDTR